MIYRESKNLIITIRLYWIGQTDNRYQTNKNQFMSAIAVKNSGFLFLNVPGGTNKTFLISLTLTKVRSEGNIALTIASSGIAATLLDSK